MSYQSTSASDMHISNSQRQSSSSTKVVAGYTLHERLGSGSFATVFKGLKIDPNAEGADTVAVKAISRASKKLTKKVLQNLEIEISILQTYRHTNIVCLQNVQKTDRHFYLVLEFCGGGDVQHLIRGRKAGRLTERLTRRLMRDLAAGLKFLWGQELIHRDIKPQNILLTGPLPLDEDDDPEKTPELENKRKAINFPSADFKLKIADFGFARHLQTSSLAETLCGSPLYMAPEILQHQRYDAKADLWSVGTVLFEMIAGRPPFNGENHIDLLRNIQRKAVRLPADVRVSMECVNLLRLLLNRNPVSRAGFKEFFDACDAFLTLGCAGTTPSEDLGICQRPTTSSDLGTIHENDTTPGGIGSMMTMPTMANQPQQAHTPIAIPALAKPMKQSSQQPIHQPLHHLRQQAMKTKSSTISPPFVTPRTLVPSPSGNQYISNISRPRIYGGLTPLESSPPPSSFQVTSSRQPLPPIPFIDSRQASVKPQFSPYEFSLPRRKNDGSPLKSSSDESGFVMVEHGSLHRTTAIISSGGDNRPHPVADSNIQSEKSAAHSQFYFNTNTLATSRGDYMFVNEAGRQKTKGILSTSPGTGVALMGYLGGRARISNEPISGNTNYDMLEARIGAVAKMVAAAEDVGRRAVSVAHLGDARAYLALRFAFANDNNPSLLCAIPMEGVEEERTCDVQKIATSRCVSTSTDKIMTDAKIIEEEEAEEMPFAISPDAPSAPFNNSPNSLPTLATEMPSRPGVSRYGKGSSGGQHVAKMTPSMIRCRFNEALSCYVKTLKMLKGSLNAVHKVEKDLESIIMHTVMRNEESSRITQMQKRCVVVKKWLSVQFQGVLERADASSTEISKVTPTQDSDIAASCVEELIYNHSLSSGREGAVKQLLGQHEAARACYRSAGLLAETLLMETNLGPDDRAILEEYVNGFALRITELDGLLLQQIEGGISAGDPSRRSGSSVIGLIGHSTLNPTFGLINQR